MEDNRTESDLNLADVSETAGTTAGYATSGEGLSSREAELERERDNYKDLLLRRSAEFENFRKRTERERVAQSESAAADLVKELLPLIDDLERALQAEAGSEGIEAYRRGVELIHRQLSELLRKRGVTPIEALGADFDPHYHQAVSYEPASGRREGEIIEEYGRGYLLGDRLLRPSMVKVAKGEA
jgi:molecular chaperone GrpE